MSERKYYVYIIRVCGIPRYVGKGGGGDGKRWLDLRNRGSALLGLIRGNEESVAVRRRIGLTEEEAFALEILLIKRFGRRDQGKGPLLNFTDGGDGVPNLSEGVRRRMGIAARSRWKDPLYREKMAVLMRENALRQWGYQEFRDRISVRQSMASKEAWSKPEVQEKHRLICQSSEYKKRASESAKKSYQSQSPEFRAGRSSSTKLLWKDPEYREKVISAEKEALAQPKERARRSNSSKKMWEDPDRRVRMTVPKEALHTPQSEEKRSTAAKKRWSDPEFRARAIAGMRAAALRRSGSVPSAIPTPRFVRRASIPTPFPMMGRSSTLPNGMSFRML